MKTSFLNHELQPMTAEEKKQIIDDILTVLKNRAIVENKFFDYGDNFITLAFMRDEDLRKIASLTKGLVSPPQTTTP